MESVDVQTTAKPPTTRPTCGKYVDKKRCASSLKNGLCSGFAPAPERCITSPKSGLCSGFAPAPGCWGMLAYILWYKAQYNGGLHFWMVKFCHGAAPSSSLCGLAWLLWLDPVLGVISRCLCVYTCIPIDEETCGVGRLLRVVGL